MESQVRCGLCKEEMPESELVVLGNLPGEATVSGHSGCLGLFNFIQVQTKDLLEALGMYHQFPLWMLPGYKEEPENYMVCSFFNIPYQVIYADMGRQVQFVGLVKDGIWLLIDRENDTCYMVKDEVKAEWVRLGEGWNGDFDEEDPEDTELLRFDISVWKDGEWKEVEDASYCTRTPVEVTWPVKVRLLRAILNDYWNAIHDRETYSVKGLGDQMSLICPADIQEQGGHQDESKTAGI